MLILRYITAGYRFRLSIMPSAGTVVKPKKEGLTPIGESAVNMDTSPGPLSAFGFLPARPADSG